MSTPSCLKFAVLGLALCSQSLLADNWPEWRGPHGDGVSTETALPLTWSATENVKWSVALPERGNSTPVIWGDRIFVTQAVGPRRTVMCFDRKKGDLLWQEGPSSSQPEKTHDTNPYCSASPVTDGERVVAWFGSAGVYCWDMKGAEQWHVDLGKQEHIWGYAASPVLLGDLCIVNFGPGERSFLVALNKKNGKEAWRTETPPPTVWEGAGAGQKWSGSWTTPVVLKTTKGNQLVLGYPGAVRGYDPATGKELWHCDGLNPLVYANPLIADDIVVGMGGFGGSALGVKIGATGDLTPQRLWQLKTSSQRIGSGVVKDGMIYMTNAPGVVQCIDPKDGKVLWQERAKTPSNRGSSWSSLTLAGDRLYLVNQASETAVLKAGPQFEQLAANALDGALSNSSVAISNGEIFIRTHKRLWCIGAK
ncbi:MAG TPA: PQQ-binding-like beta-propeller repeat protein [Chthoniobacteraceae bacterium]|jgi:outer membrane protein assembly factor BamB|nr:PQQ-binding-like beta-propeller repeat protein [Chthoniobacteraceae bacterium]